MVDVDAYRHITGTRRRDCIVGEIDQNAAKVARVYADERIAGFRGGGQELDPPGECVGCKQGMNVGEQRVQVDEIRMGRGVVATGTWMVLEQVHQSVSCTIKGPQAIAIAYAAIGRHYPGEPHHRMHQRARIVGHLRQVTGLRALRLSRYGASPREGVAFGFPSAQSHS